MFGTTGPFAVSPASDYIVFIAPSAYTRQLHLRRLDAFEATPIPGTENALFPFISPDGEWIGFDTGDELKKVAPSGGSVVTLCRCYVDAPADWTYDDRIIFSSRGRLYELPTAGGEAFPISPGPDETGFWIQQPHTLPGDAVLFTTYRSDRYTSDVGVYFRSTGESRILIQNGTSPGYVSTGHVVYFNDGALHTVPYDVESHEIPGASRPVVENVRALSGFSQTGPIALYDVTRDGTLVYAPAGEAADRQLFWVDRSGVREPASEKLRAYQRPRLS